MSSENLYLGIDIGGTKIAAALVTSDGAVTQRVSCPTPAQEGGARVLEDTIRLARSVLGTETVRGIGIGTGGQVDAARGVIFSATDLLPGWAGTDVKSAFEHAYEVTTAVDNDVNALAVGEARFGMAHGLPTVAFLALGTGLGGALMLNGRLHHGAHWTGGEFGHLLLTYDPDARRDGGGHSGTLEAYASGTGLVETWRVITGDRTRLISGHDIAAEAVRDKESDAARAVRQTGEFLGFGLVSLANALDPDLIVIGGGLAGLGEMLLAPARAVLSARALPGPRTCPVVVASLGADAAVIGAAALAMPAAPKVL